MSGARVAVVGPGGSATVELLRAAGLADAVHLDELGALGSFSGHVLCDSPIDLGDLGLDPARTAFDFPLRESRLAAYARDATKDGTLGALVSASAIVSQGLAFAPSYRAGAIGITLVHWVDLFVDLFGEPTKTAWFPARVSGAAGSADTGRAVLVFASGATASIVVSDAAPRCTEAQLVGTEGIVCLRDGRLELLGPRDTFDADGRFSEPPVRRAEACEPEVMLQSARAASVRAFVEAIGAGHSFEATAFAAGLRSNRIALSLLK